MTEESIRRIRDSYGENRPVTDGYEPSLAATCRNVKILGSYEKETVL